MTNFDPAESAEAERDGAYRERAHLVALLAAMTEGAVIAPALDLDEHGWWIAYLKIGGRQASWHISPRDAELFLAVDRVEPDDPRAQWDGHTTEAKYAWISQHTVELTQERGPEGAEAAIARVRALHYESPAYFLDSNGRYQEASVGSCPACLRKWPCATGRALAEPTQDQS